MKTILIYPDLAYSELQRPSPPYSVLFIANALKQVDIDVGVFDLRFDSTDDVLNAIASHTPEYIGISTMTGPQILNALAIASAIREVAPESQLVWGGIHPTILPHQTIHNPYVDLVIRGDGERAYTQLIQGTNWSRIRGLVVKQEGKIHDNGLAQPVDMSSVHIPWELIDPSRYIVRGRTSILTSRGCPYRCAFCYNSIFQQPWRGWTVKQCINELDQFIAYGAEDILFFDDAFFANMDRVHKLLQYFRSEKLVWTAEIRVDKLTRSLAQKFQRAGCQRLFFGAESGSSRMLRLLNKGITVSQILRSARIVHEANIDADYSWMVGIPTETSQDRHNTLVAVKAIQRINPAAEFVIKIYTPYPGTALYRLAIQDGAQMPQSLTGWSTSSRYRAPSHLPSARKLETIALISAIMGRKITRDMRGTIMSLLRSIAKLRWNYEFFDFPWESFIYRVISSFLEQHRTKKLSQATKSAAKSLFSLQSEETFAR